VSDGAGTREGEAPGAGGSTFAAVLATFSPARNLRELVTPPREYFAPLDGIRALFPSWVILAHCVFVCGTREYRAGMHAEPGLRCAILAHYALEAFFVLSGFLLANLLMREHERTGTLNLGRYFLRRAARILPTYYVAIVVFAAVHYPHREHLFYNVFYLNNFLPIARQFMPWTWSLAVEEHFYIALPFLLLLMYRSRHFRGLFWLGLFALACFIRLILVDTYELTTALSDPTARGLIVIDTLYTKSYSRFGAVVLGVIVAYVFRQRADLTSRIERSPALSWLLAGGALACMLGLSTAGTPLDIPYFQLENTWPTWLRPAALALGRYLFSLAFACLILLSLGRSSAGRVLGRLLSPRPFYPIAQLSYGVYLFHPLVIESFPRPEPTYASVGGLFVKSAVLTYALALVVHLAVERPFMNLRKVWRRAA
jgi:peptidoglycan/LPS O-acetylase OafA/YrhL